MTKVKSNVWKELCKRFEKNYDITQARPLFIGIFLTFLVIVGFGFIYFLQSAVRGDYLTREFTLGIGITILIIFLGTLALREVRNFLKQNVTVVNIFLVIATITLTATFYYVDQLSDFQRTNQLLVRTNELNIEYSNAFVTNITDSKLTYAQYLTSPYEENLAFIEKNFPVHDCAKKYEDVTLSMIQSNEVNRSINDFSAWYQVQSLQQSIENTALLSERKTLIINGAKSINSKLITIQHECHNIPLNFWQLIKYMFLGEI